MTFRTIFIILILCLTQGYFMASCASSKTIETHGTVEEAEAARARDKKKAKKEAEKAKKEAEKRFWKMQSKEAKKRVRKSRRKRKREARRKRR